MLVILMKKNRTTQYSQHGELTLNAHQICSKCMVKTALSITKILYKISVTARTNIHTMFTHPGCTQVPPRCRHPAVYLYGATWIYKHSNKMENSLVLNKSSANREEAASLSHQVSIKVGADSQASERCYINV